MDYVIPYDQIGISPPGPWQNASPAAGTRGSILNALVFPPLLNEILNVQDAAGLTRSAADFTQLLQALKILIPKYSAGVATNGGLAADGSNDLLLAFLNLLADTRAAPAGNDLLALERMSDGSTVSITTAKLGAYIASLFQQNATFSQITPTNLVGLSLSQTGDYMIPRGVTTTVPLLPITVNSGFGTLSNGVLTVKKSGYYLFCFSGAMFIQSNGHTNDFAKFSFTIVPGGSISNRPPIHSGGGQAQASFLSTNVQHLNAGDQVQLQALADNDAGDGFNAGVSGYTNMLVALLNS